MTIEAYRIPNAGPFDARPLAFANRARYRGLGATAPAGVLAVSADALPAARRYGLVLEAAAGGASAATAPDIRVAIYAGVAIGYPYWGYYAHALLSIGRTFEAIDADDILDGALDHIDLLVLPGGFATWGLDRAEAKTGVDDRVSTFIRAGGRVLGSCGGAFYLSSGRPGWLGALDATPRFTQEYLSTGAGLVSISEFDEGLAAGLPEAVELPYFHGPIYTCATRTAQTGARFRDFVAATGAFIENPLSQAFFDRAMHGAPAVLHARMGRGAVLAFSPHPEMGEFVRKGMILDTYVRRFLPIRGEQVMDETVRFLGGDDSAGFRLIENAVELLQTMSPISGESTRPRRPEPEQGVLTALIEAMQGHVTMLLDRVETIGSNQDPVFRSLLAKEVERRRTELADLLPRLHTCFVARRAAPDIARALVASLKAAGRHGERAVADGPAESLVLAELPLRICSVAVRLETIDRAFIGVNE